MKDLIRKMAEANPLRGALRIHGELLKLGIEVSERTVSGLFPTRRRSPFQIWRAFLNNHIEQLISIDFFTVPAALIILAVQPLRGGPHHRLQINLP